MTKASRQRDSYKKQLKKKGWVEGDAFDTEVARLMDAWMNSRPYSVKPPPPPLKRPAATLIARGDARIAYTDLAHEATILCDRAVCLDIRYQRVCVATLKNTEGMEPGEEDDWCGLGQPFSERVGLENWDFSERVGEHVGLFGILKNVHGNIWEGTNKGCISNTLLLPNGKARPMSLAEQQKCHERVKTLGEVLQFQIDNKGRLPSMSKPDPQENDLRKRFNHVLKCKGRCYYEVQRLRWIEMHRGPLRKYLLGMCTVRGKSFRSNAARNYRAIKHHLKTSNSEDLEWIV
jgi:hypothetical protein